MRSRRQFVARKWAAACGLAALAAVPAIAAAQSDAERGKELAFDRTKGNCLACHALADGKLTGTVGPPLENMEARYPDRELLFKRVWDERQFNPQTPMPPFGPHKILTREEVSKIVDFLYTQ